MAEVMHSLSIVLFVLSGVFVALTIILFKVFNVPNLIGDLSGRNARKSIALMRKENEKKLERKKKSVTPVNSYKQETSGRRLNVLNDSGHGTGVLSDNSVQIHSNMETVLLEAGNTESMIAESGETMPLSNGAIPAIKPVPRVSVSLLEEELLIHTDETI